MTTFARVGTVTRETLGTTDGIVKASGVTREVLLERPDCQLRVAVVVREVLRPFFRRPQAIQWRLNW